MASQGFPHEKPPLPRCNMGSHHHHRRGGRVPSPSRDLPEQPSHGTGTSLPIIYGAVILNKRRKKKGGGCLLLPMMPSGGRGKGKKNKTSCSRFVTSGHGIIALKKHTHTKIKLVVA